MFTSARYRCSSNTPSGPTSPASGTSATSRRRRRCICTVDWSSWSLSLASREKKENTESFVTMCMSYSTKNWAGACTVLYSTVCAFQARPSSRSRWRMRASRSSSDMSRCPDAGEAFASLALPAPLPHLRSLGVAVGVCSEACLPQTRSRRCGVSVGLRESQRRCSSSLRGVPRRESVSGCGCGCNCGWSCARRRSRRTGGAETDRRDRRDALSVVGVAVPLLSPPSRGRSHSLLSFCLGGSVLEPPVPAPATAPALPLMLSP